MERKTDAVRRLVAEGDFKGALRIASDFRIGITQEDHDVMKRGYECYTNPGFYKSIRIDPAKSINKAIETVSRLYG